MSIPTVNSADPFLEFATNGNNPLTILITEFPKQCCLCKHESNSLFILTFNKLACVGCFDFVLTCNFFNQTHPIDLKLRHPHTNLETQIYRERDSHTLRDTNTLRDSHKQ